jgi:Amt family ammonium transporter
VGLFAEDKITGVATGNDLFFGGGFELLSTQVIGSVSVIAFTPFSHLLDAIKATMGLRVSRDEEIEGLDLGEHGREA